jgi:membrane protease YdiL (CAAX protease family)
MTPRELYTSETPKGWLPWGALAPFLCIFLLVLSSLPMELLLERLHLIDSKGPVGAMGLFAFLTLPFGMTGLVCLGWTRFIEGRSAASIGLLKANRARLFLQGHLVGLLTLSLVVLAIGLSGGFGMGGLGPALTSPLALAQIGLLLLGFALQSSVEEILFRGWLLSLLARKFNVVLGVLLSSLVFTLLHFSPRQHWATTLSSFLFSVFTCTWAIRSGHIWGVMGWHAGWNWLLAVGFELPVTGLNAGLPALLVKLNPRGTVILTGGTQGPEGSLWCSVFFLLAIAYLWWRPLKPLADAAPEAA